MNQLTEILTDRSHGASEIEERLLGALLDLVEDPLVPATETLLAELTRAVRRHQPVMANLLQLANRAWLAWEGGGSEEAARRRRLARLFSQRRDDRGERLERLAAHLAQALTGPTGGPWRLLTLSRSGTVIRALGAAVEAGADLVAVVGEGRPGGEGLAAAAGLRARGVDAWAATDAAVAALAWGAPPPRPFPATERRTSVVVGADAVGPEAFVNKVGTRALAAAARDAGAPCWVLAESSKLLPRQLFDRLELPPAPAGELGAPAGVPALSFYFEAVPLELATAVIGEDGAAGPGEVRRRAARRPVSRRLLECLEEC